MNDELTEHQKSVEAATPPIDFIEDNLIDLLDQERREEDFDDGI